MEKPFRNNQETPDPSHSALHKRLKSLCHREPIFRTRDVQIHTTLKNGLFFDPPVPGGRFWLSCGVAALWDSCEILSCRRASVCLGSFLGSSRSRNSAKLLQAECGHKANGMRQHKSSHMNGHGRTEPTFMFLMFVCSFCCQKS